MTYNASEISTHGGRPVELYRYKGTYQSFYYTSGPVAVSYQADDEAAPNNYVPMTTRRSAVTTTTQADDNSEVTVDLPVSAELVGIYGFQLSPPSLELTIFRGHNPGEFIRYWNGEVENIVVNKGMAQIRVPSRLAAALSADFPNVYYQGPCNHTLFDERCGVDQSLWDQNTTMTVVNGKTITVASVGTLTGQLLGGDALLPSGERRMIVAQVGNVLTLNYPFAEANVGEAIILLAGCDLAWMGDCKNRFNNTEKFGGFPFIPPRNIFAAGLEGGKDVTDEPCLPEIAIFEGWYFMFRSVLFTNLPGEIISRPSNHGAHNLFSTPAGYSITNTNPCLAYGSGGYSKCLLNTSADDFLITEFRYDVDVVAALSGVSFRSQRQHGDIGPNTRQRFQYRRWQDGNAWTTIMGVTGDGVDAQTAIDGSVDYGNTFPYDNYWTMP